MIMYLGVKKISNIKIVYHVFCKCTNTIYFFFLHHFSMFHISTVFNPKTTQINILRLVRSYKTMSVENSNKGITRHYPPASKEWKNSVYSYNKTYGTNLPFKDESISSLITSYFSFIPLLNKRDRSRRMRMSARRTSTKKFFVSKPEIKQNSDKAIITVYTYDRQKVIFNKKLYLMRKLLLENGLAFTSFLRGNSSLLTDKITSNVIGRNVRRITRDPVKDRFLLKKQMYKHKVKPYLYAHNVMLSIYKKRNFLNCLFFFYFMKWALSLFKLKVDLKSNFLITKNENKKVLNIRNKNLTLDKLRKINIILLQYFLAELDKITLENRQSIDLNTLFLEFKSKYHTIFMKKYLKRVLSTLKMLSLFNFNKRRYLNMVGGMKSMIYMLYSKKVELNLVNLKYIHMNSDNFTDAVATKLKRKKGRLLRVLKKSLKLIKRPPKFSARFDNTSSITKPKQTWNNDIKTTLNSIKYKWVMGIRIEARGRLTRRYTASRSVYKPKYKGSLRNLEHLYNTNYKAESPSFFMLRNQFRPNIQSSYTFDNKRIGSFGIKGWISSI